MIHARITTKKNDTLLVHAPTSVALGCTAGDSCAQKDKTSTGANVSKKRVWWCKCHGNIAFIYAHKQYYKSAASALTPGEIAAFVTKRAFSARSTIMHAKRVMSTLAIARVWYFG